MPPRPEHPRPQFQRADWLTLNGEWRFAFDFGLSGEAKGWHEDPAPLDRTVTVPFCPESVLSGIGHTDFIPCVWYHRQVSLPDGWDGKRVLIHFGAVDFDTQVWVNGGRVGRHVGGSASFSFDVTGALRKGANDIVVAARDDTRSPDQPGGKQSPRLGSFGCHYTRTTGIWQTVWLEAVPASRVDSVQIVPDLDGSRFALTPTFVGCTRRHSLRGFLLDGDDIVTEETTPAVSGGTMVLHVDAPRAWSPADPHLYDIRLELLEDGDVIDTVNSYGGLRKIHIEGNRLFLNNAPFFVRFVLDQGFYPDGIWTAPSDEALKADIERSLAVGFNGARLHQKVFEERFHYWADRLGYLTWGEYSDWGMSIASGQSAYNHQQEWREIVRRDRNHPSIIAWTPFNETAGHARSNPEAHARVLSAVYDLTKALDPTRPVNDASGYTHVKTDLFTYHDYQQDPAIFAETFAGVSPDEPGKVPVKEAERSAPYEGQPYIVDEYGGTWWSAEDAAKEQDPQRESSWGYGKRPVDVEEVYHRIERLTAVLTDNPNIAGYTYTQLTDVEQEQNGIYAYNRDPKFDPERLKKAFGRPAAIEKEIH